MLPRTASVKIVHFLQLVQYQFIKNQDCRSLQKFISKLEVKSTLLHFSEHFNIRLMEIGQEIQVWQLPTKGLFFDLYFFRTLSSLNPLIDCYEFDTKREKVCDTIFIDLVKLCRLSREWVDATNTSADQTAVSAVVYHDVRLTLLVIVS